MKKYITFYIFLTGFLLYNFLVVKNLWLGIILSLIYLLYFGRRLGILTLPQFSGFWQRLFGPLFLLTAISFIGTLIYYFYRLNDLAIAIIIGLLPLLIIPYAKYLKKNVNDWTEGRLEPVPIEWPNIGSANFGGWLVFFGDLYLINYLIKHATTEAIRSPWTVISPKIFLIFFILSWLLLIFLKRTKSNFRALVTVFLHVFLMLSAALIIYQIGFGFDPILHRAAEKHIFETGIIEPKTPFYIGQYAIVVIISKITLLSISIVDKFLLIILEALFLPPLLFLVFRHGFNFERQESRSASILLFLFPFSSFIATTPQDTANFFGLTMLFFTVIYLTTTLISWRLPFFLALTTFFVHPLTGLPIIIFFILTLIFKTHIKLSEHPAKQFLIDAIGFLFFFGSLFIIPLIFALFFNASIHQPNLNLIKDYILPNLPKPRHGAPFIWWQAAIYFYQFILPFIIAAGTIFGGFKLIKKNPKFKLLIIALFVSFIIFTSNAILLKSSIVLSNIGNSEQGQYAERMRNFSVYILLPIFLAGLIFFTFWLEKKSTQAGLRGITNFFMLLILAGGITASFYLSYPRIDSFTLGRYINTSVHDIEAVKEIEKNAGGEPYIVLSNISFSAAAVQEFGFKKYYAAPNGQIFFYSIPTGGPLYGLFENMAYKGATKETMLEAMNLTGVNQSYFALNNYWDSFAKSSREAKHTAYEWWSVDKEKILIFKYKRGAAE